MKLVYLASISTGIIIALGVVLISPAFLRNHTDATARTTPLIIVFDVRDTHGYEPEVSEWCKDLADLVELHEIKATIFQSGNIAQNNPECVTSFPNYIDIGSQTNNYVNLQSVDYSIALEEVSAGKRAIDSIGQLNSKLFKAPNGATDENIYSLLNRSGILADFSYADHYNVHENGQFIRYPVITLDGRSIDLEKIQATVSSGGSTPLIILFDNTMELSEINGVILLLQNNLTPANLEFVNASELTGIDLTVREDE